MSLTTLTGAKARPGQAAEKVTPQRLLAQKRDGIAITALTAYDYPSARLVDEAGVDLLLVGDSLAMAVLGHEDTLSVTMAEMLHHARAVRRGVKRALLAVDLPYGSYQVSVEQAVRSGLRMVKQGGAEAVKLEGGARMAGRVRALTEAEIPVIGHLGLTPQSVHRMGGYHVQGRTEEAAAELLEDALALEEAGAIAVVLEGIPRELAAQITGVLTVPTIGIGAGPECDGQILVWHDLFGVSFRSPAKFVRQFGDADRLMRGALAEFCEAVRERTFPSDSESYHMPGKRVRSATTHADQALACAGARS